MQERRDFKKAIDERTVLFRRDPPVDEFGNEIIGEPRNPTALQRKGKRLAEQVIGPTFEDLKKTATELPGKIGRGAKAVGEGLFEAVTIVPRTKAAIAADPEGAKQFVSAVMSGDREAIRSMATEASEGVAEPFATFGDVTLGGMAAQEGKFGEAAMYGGLILAPGILQTLGKSMSKGWLKSAAEAGEEIPDEAARKMNDLAKRVDEGKVTDDMQIRREIAMIEDDHAYDYQASLGERDTDFDFESVSRTPAGGDGADALLEAINRRTQEIERRLADLEFSTDEYGNPFQMREVDLELELEDLYDQRQKILSRRGGGGTPGGGGGGVAAFKKDQAAEQEYFRSTGEGVYEPEKSSPKFGLANQGHHNVVEDLGPLLPQDRNLLEEFAGKYNLSETELRQLRDEYVAYGYDDFPSRSQRGFEEIDIPDDRSRGGGPPSGKPPGGEVEDLFPHQNLLDKAQKSGLDIPTWLRGAPGEELIYRPIGKPKEFDNPGFVEMIETEGFDTDYLSNVNEYLTLRRNSLKEQYDDQLRLAYQDYPNRIDTAAIEEADKLRLDLEQFSRAYDESTNSMRGNFVRRFARDVEVVRVDLRDIEQTIGLNSQIVNFANRLERSLADELTTRDINKNPILPMIKEAFENMASEPIDANSKRSAYRALEDMFDDYRNLDKAKQLHLASAPTLSKFRGNLQAHNRKRFVNEFLNNYYSKYGTPISDNRGVTTKSLDDIEGPSDAEIEEMVGQASREELQEAAKRRNFERFGSATVEERLRRNRERGKRDRPFKSLIREQGQEDN